MIKEIKDLKLYAPRLLELSKTWEMEAISYGYHRNELSDLMNRRIFVVEENHQILAYLMGRVGVQKMDTSVIRKDQVYFEIDELYVVREKRSSGLGKELMSYVEKVLKKASIEVITLTTSTKNYQAILHFYIEIMGMEFWSAKLFKKLQ